MKGDKSIYKIKRIHCKPENPFDGNENGRHYTKLSHSSLSNIYLSICQEGIQRVP
jgi:hypothetical protein